MDCLYNNSAITLKDFMENVYTYGDNIAILSTSCDIRNSIMREVVANLHEGHNLRTLFANDLYILRSNFPYRNVVEIIPKDKKAHEDWYYLHPSRVGMHCVADVSEDIYYEIFFRYLVTDPRLLCNADYVCSFDFDTLEEFNIMVINGFLSTLVEPVEARSMLHPKYIIKVSEGIIIIEEFCN